MDTNKINALDWYQRQIFEYIREYHPQLFLNKKDLEQTIIARANAAQEAYTAAILRGDNQLEARQEANQALHAFLVFSPCSYLKEFYKEVHGEEIDDYKAVAIWQKTKDIFEPYGEDFEGTDAEDKLRAELRPFIIATVPKQIKTVEI